MKNKNLIENEKPIYIFPLTAEAVFMYHVLKNNGFEVVGLCDNDTDKHGKTYLGTPVVKPVGGENETVIICGHRLYIHSYLFSKSIKIEELLEECDVDPALAAIDKVAFEAVSPKQMTKLGRLRQEIRQVIIPNDASFIMNTINVSVTECCNLKCRYCAAMMQYYEKPKHMPLETLKNDIELLLTKFDYVRDIHILGGEPFIYPHLAEYAQFLKSHRAKIGSLYLITNGTVLPKGEVIDALIDAEVLVRISDYGEQSRRKGEIVETFKQRGGEAQITKYPWTWENQLTYDDDSDIQHKFECCFAKRFNNCISEGKIYYCDFLENSEKLHTIPYHPRNSLDLAVATQDTIKAYFSSTHAAPGCKYCSGHDHKLEIEAAEQVDKPLPYQHFDESYVK